MNRAEWLNKHKKHRQEMLQLKNDGMTYEAIAKKYKVGMSAVSAAIARERREAKESGEQG